MEISWIFMSMVTPHQVEDLILFIKQYDYPQKLLMFYKIEYLSGI